METEISKNKLILGLICVIIFFGALMSIQRVITWEDEQEPYKIGSDSSFVFTSSNIINIGSIDTIFIGARVKDSIIAQLRRENARLESELKQKSKPVGLKVVPYYDAMDLRSHHDTLASPYWKNKWDEDSDTTWINDSIYLMKSQLPIY